MFGKKQTEKNITKFQLKSSALKMLFKKFSYQTVAQARKHKQKYKKFASIQRQLIQNVIGATVCAFLACTSIVSSSGTN